MEIQTDITEAVRDSEAVDIVPILSPARLVELLDALARERERPERIIEF